MAETNAFTVKTIRIDGEPIEYLVWGSGPKDILFIHGLGGTCRHWQKTIAKIKPGYRCWALTLPDYPNRHLEGYIEIVKEFIHRQKLHHATLVGHSLGGVIALYLYLENRVSQPEKLILVAIPLTINPPETAKDVARMIKRMAAKKGLIRKLSLAAVKGFLGQKRVSQAFLRNVFNCLSDILKLHESVGFDENIPRGPALFNYVNIHLLHWLFRHWQKLDQADPTTVITLDCGHFIPTTHPRELAGIINQFLEAEN